MAHRVILGRPWLAATWKALHGLIALAALAVGSVSAQPSELHVLSLQDVRKIADKSQGFDEPSGLALASDGGGYWTVSDGSGGIFWLAPDGRLEPSRTRSLGVKDLEGIVVDSTNGRMLAVSEDRAAIVSARFADGSVELHPLHEMNGFTQIATQFGAPKSENGLEGIAIDRTNGNILVIKEFGPRLLVRISSDLSTIIDSIELTESRGFSCSGTPDGKLDVSDLVYDSFRKSLWILSDTGACILFFDLVTGQATGLKLPGSLDNSGARIKNAEGIALNSDGAELRIVTDDGKDSRLYVFSIE